MTLLREAIQLGFVQRALVAGAFLAIACAVVGFFMVLRRQAMIGDGLAHFTFAAVGLGLFLGAAPLAVAAPLVVLASLVILRLPEKTALLGDTAIGMISVLGLAGGILLASLGQGFNVDLFTYLFGDILAITRTEAWLATGVSVVVVGLVLLHYHELFALSFDPAHAQVSGVRATRLTRQMAVLVALIVVLGVRLVGTLLISGLLIFPAATALQWARRFATALALAAGLAAGGVLLGILTAFVLNLPAGATIILVQAAFFAIALLRGRH